MTDRYFQKEQETNELDKPIVSKVGRILDVNYDTF